MERGEKRSLEGSEDDHHQQQHGKRPALAIENSSTSCHQQQYDVDKRPKFASVMVGALTVDTFQTMIRSSVEPIIRKVVREEVKSAVDLELAKLSGRVGVLPVDDFWEIVQRAVREEVNSAMANIGPAKLSERSSPKQIEGTSSPKQIDETVGRNLQLYLRTRLSLPHFTGGKVEGEQGAAILVVLIDATNGHGVTSGPESSVKLDIVVLDGDFNNEESDSWTQEEFEKHVLKERDGKRPLLTGDLQVTLKEGVGTLGGLTFTDNSSWVRSKKFRLGLKVASGYCEGIRIREAKTEAFSVKDHRGELYKKHYPPALEDEVWRLKKIAKDCPFHLRLHDAGISKVEDFLRFVVTEPQKLRNILGRGMSNKMWDALIEHAKTCRLNGRLYVYYPVDLRGVGVVFNNIFEMSGFIDGEQYYSADSLSDTQKVIVDILAKKAYDNLNNLQEYGGESLLSFKQNQNSCMTRNEVQAGPSNYPNILDNQLQPAILPVPLPSEPSPVDPSMLIAGSGPIDSMTTSYSAQPQLMNTTSSQAQFDSSSVAPHD